MRAWRFHEFGDISNLKLEEAPMPEPAEGEALVKLAYAGLNPADHFMVLGKYPRPAPRPFSVGRDGSGTIVESRGGRFKPGEEVIVLRSEVGVSRTGTLAEYVTVPEASLAPLPEGWSLEEGAVGPLAHLTAWQALVDNGNLQAGETVLVTGSSGGVGTAAIVLAKALGARVVAMSRSAEKQDRLRELGADVVIDTNPETFEEAVKEGLDGGRVNLVVENLGGPWLQHCVNVCDTNARIMVIGLLAGLKSEVILGLLIFKCLRIQGMNVGAYTPDQSQKAWAGIVQALAENGQRPLIDTIFPFEEVQEAFAKLGQGPFGKVGVRIS
jgi:NADPH2:quinone reductase